MVVNKFLLSMIFVLLLVGVVIAGVLPTFGSITFPTDSEYYASEIDSFSWALSPDFIFDNCWYSINGGNDTVVNCNDLNATIPSLSDGEYTLLLQTEGTLAVNGFDGVQTIDEIPFYVDTTAPSDLAFDNLVSGDLLFSNLTDVIVSFVEANPESCWLEVNSVIIPSESCSGVTHTFSDVQIGEGDNNIIFYIEDKAGNQAAVGIGGIYVDSIDPEIIITNFLESPDLNYIGVTSFQIIGQLIETNPRFVYVMMEVKDPNDFPHIDAQIFDPVTKIFSKEYVDIYNGDGHYDFTVSTEDTIGNEGSATGTIVIDTTLPAIIINSPLASESPYDYVVDEINFNVDDANPDYCVFSDGSFVSENIADCDFPYSFNSTEGDNTWTITAYDKAGNSNSSSVSFFVDSIPPLVYFDIGSVENSTIYAQDWIFVNASAYDISLDTLTIDLRDDDEIIDSVSVVSNGSNGNLEANFSDLEDGYYSIVIWATDSAGHINWTARIFGLDSTPPDYYNVVIPEDTTYIFGAGYEFNISWADAIAGVDSAYIEFNGVNYSMFREDNDFSQSFSDLPAGTYNYYFWANDSFGNVNISDAFTFTINKATPVGNLNVAPALSVELGTEVSLSLSESNLGDGDVTYSIYVDGVNVGSLYSWTPGFDVYTITLESSEGQNYSASVLDTQTLTVGDTTAPVITLDLPENNYFEQFDGEGNSIDVSFNVVDEGELSCAVYLNDVIDGNAGSEGSWYYTFNGLGSGQYSWYVLCSDASGNNGTSETKYFTILSDLENINNFTNYTDLGGVDDITNVTWFYVENEFGSINFTAPIDFSSGADWTQYIIILNNSIYVDSSGPINFNVPAIISFFGLGWTTPELLINSGVAGVSINYVNGTATTDLTSNAFPGETTYTTQEYVAPVSPPSGPSGGSSPGGGGCTTSWNCTVWSDCAGGEMTRTCSKLKESCAIYTDKPVEVLACTMPAEDGSGGLDEEVSSRDGTDLGEPAAITGGTIGTGGKVAIGALILIILVGGAYLIVRAKRNKMTKTRTKAMVEKVGMKNRAKFAEGKK